nr:pleckstrin homology-like domain family A member 1 [Nomia melanderi]
MGPPGISVQQQLMQSVRSPPPIRSPQPNPSPRPVPSPRNQPVPSPRSGPVPSPHHHPPHGTPTHSPAHELGGPSEMMLSQLNGGTGAPTGHPGAMPHHPSPAPPPTSGADSSEVTPMTPQDQLSKFVEGL